MTKVQIMDEINKNLYDIKDICIQDLMTSRQDDIISKFEIGEYAFFEIESQEEFDEFFDDMKSYIKEETGYNGDLVLRTWSSKSGTSVFIDAFEYNIAIQDVVGDFEYEWRFIHDYSKVGDFTHSELNEIYSNVRILKKEILSKRAEYDKMVEEITKIVDSMSEGKHSGCFSNGEVIFSPTDPTKKSFTAYYNPNHECD